MAAQYPNNSPESKLQKISEAIEAGSTKQVARVINKGLAPSDIAHLIESSPPKQRALIWRLLEQGLKGEVLQYLGEDVQLHFLSKLNTQELSLIHISAPTRPY